MKKDLTFQGKGFLFFKFSRLRNRGIQRLQEGRKVGSNDLRAQRQWRRQG